MNKVFGNNYGGFCAPWTQSRLYYIYYVLNSTTGTLSQQFHSYSVVNTYPPDTTIP